MYKNILLSEKMKLKDSEHRNIIMLLKKMRIKSFETLVVKFYLILPKKTKQERVICFYLGFLDSLQLY